MDAQISLSIGTFFTVIFGIVNMIVILVLANIMKDLRELNREHHALKDEVQTNYATKQELLRLEGSISSDIHEIKGIISNAVAEFRKSTTRLHDRIDTYIEKLSIVSHNSNGNGNSNGNASHGL